MNRLARFGWLIPAFVFVLHALVFGGWIHDDAGISFAYAKNLAQGHGLVAQPAAVPLEGFANILWVALLAFFYLIHLFNVVWTPKILAVLFIAAAFAILSRALGRVDPWGAAVALTGLTVAALQPGFVIWSVSGLENPLTVLLACTLLAACLRLFDYGRLHFKRGSREHEGERIGEVLDHILLGIGTALIAAVLALAWPDGLIYCLAFPLLALIRLRSLAKDGHGLGPRAGAAPFNLSGDRARAEHFRALRLGFAAYFLTFGALYGCSVLFRWLYFHDLYPNLAFAGRSADFRTILSAVLLRTGMSSQAAGLFHGLGGEHGVWLLVALAFAAGYAWLSGRARALHVVLGIFTLLSGLVYVLLPDADAAGFRYASAFFVFFYCLVMALARTLADGFPLPAPIRKGIFTAVAVVCLAETAALAARRSPEFARHPAVPLAKVAEHFGTTYNHFADVLRIQSGSLMLPETGGTLLTSRMRVIGVGALCDRDIARSVGLEQDELFDYVLEQARPTFIHLHDSWSEAAALEHDERFQRDYLPLFDSVEPFEPDAGQAGDYVRKDAVIGRDPEMAVVRAELVAYYTHPQ